ncbi:MAG: tetratricopeptide repeat protein [Deltaproteobacteria bacterium]|nr:tetratricopeptide repeat protein [Deltaproteobacteria bacterium]
MRTLLLAALFTLLSSPASAQSLQRIFSSANEAYFRGDFASAAKDYEKIVQAGVRDADVYFNLATAYARAGEYGKAILFYERGLKAKPGDEAAEAGLAACRNLLGKREAEKQGEAVVQTRPPLSEALVRPFSENLLAGLLLLFDFAFFALLIALRLSERESLRIGLGIAAPLIGFLLILTVGGLLVKSEALKEGRAAIVINDEAAIREGPDPRAQARGKAQQGQSARIIKGEADYVRVRLSDGSEGWMKRSDVEAI